MVGPLGGSPVVARNRLARHNGALTEVLDQRSLAPSKENEFALDSSMLAPGHCFRSRGQTSWYRLFVRSNLGGADWSRGSEPPGVAMTVVAGYG
jgi:hypothetical protein